MLLEVPHSKEVRWVIKAATTMGLAISQLELDKSGERYFPSGWREGVQWEDGQVARRKTLKNYHVKRITDSQEVA